MTRATTSRPRMVAIYPPGTVRADLIDIHPITGHSLTRAVWWLIETKEQP